MGFSPLTLGGTKVRVWRVPVEKGMGLPFSFCLIHRELFELSSRLEIQYVTSSDFNCLLPICHVLSLSRRFENLPILFFSYLRMFLITLSQYLKKSALRNEISFDSAIIFCLIRWFNSVWELFWFRSHSMTVCVLSQVCVLRIIFFLTGCTSLDSNTRSLYTIQCGSSQPGAQVTRLLFQRKKSSRTWRIKV